MASWELSKYIETKLQTTCFHHILNFFKKWKEVWNYSPCLIFRIILKEKYISCYVLLTDQISLPDCLYFEILGNMWTAIVFKPGYDVMNFEVNLIFLIKPFFLHDQNVVTKTKISWERKQLLRWNKKYFSSFLKGFESSK